MRISNIHASPIQNLNATLNLESRESSLVILGEELGQLKTIEGLPHHIVLKGDVTLCFANIHSFSLLKSKDVEIEGSLSCENRSFSEFLGQDREDFQENQHGFFPQKLKVNGNVVFSAVSELSSLPKIFEVKGNLDLSECIALTQLPNRLKVQGDLDLSGCTALTLLPQECEVQGSAILSDCIGLTALPNGFKISGDLDLSHCTSLIALPKELEVQGRFHLPGCTALTALPNRLKVGGDLDLSNCTSLTFLPEGLEVQEMLDLSGCTALTAIPSGLKVGGDLDLSNCTSLIFLPEGLEVQAMLDLLRCIALTTLPNGLKVKGDLDLSDCTSLTFFPEKLEVQGRLSLSGCTALTAIPKGFKVEGSLDCSDCKGLTHIPEGLNVPGNLNLSHCISLTALPNGLKVGGDFNLSGCKQLTRLPEELEVQGRFNLSHCTALTTIPKGFKVKKSLNLSHCTSLTHLPEELEVQGRLNLFGCTALITMPSRLQVKNSLNLSHCIQLTTLPDQLELGGDLDLSGCTSLSSLPHWVATLGYCSDGDIRSIDLTGSGLSPLIIQRLQAEALNHAGVQFYFSEDAVEAYIMEFEALLPALEFWEKEAKEAPIDLETICYKLHQLLTQVQDHENLLTFLMRLTGTADFYNAATREFLAKRVLKLIQLMAQNTEICHHAAFLIHQGLSSCDDRVMTTLSDMGFYQKLQDLQHPSVKAEELKKSAKGFFFLEQLSQKIEKHINTLQFVDEVEVYMAFHIRLQKMLNLPIDIQNMLFRKCVAISNEEIDHIGKELLEGFSEEAFNSFLMSWDPWNLYQRRLSVLDWDHLPMANKRMFSTDICPYLQDLPTRPVLYNHVVYDYDAFVKRYIQEGVDLYGVKVQIKNLLRMKSSLAESSTLEDGKEEDSLIKQELKKLKK